MHGACAGTCRGLKPLQPHSETVKGCPECRAPISGLLRYGRISNKRMVDRMDDKFAQHHRMSLTRLTARLAEISGDPDRDARQGGLDLHRVAQLLAEFDAIAAECMRPPSLVVGAAHEHVPVHAHAHARCLCVYMHAPASLSGVVQKLACVFGLDHLTDRGLQDYPCPCLPLRFMTPCHASHQLLMTLFHMTYSLLLPGVRVRVQYPGAQGGSCPHQ